MEYCMDSKSDIASAWLLLILVSGVNVVLVLFLLDKPVWVSVATSIIALFSIVFSALILVGAILLFLLNTRKFRITKDGLQIRYITGTVCSYGWDEISEIGICKVRYAAKDISRYKTVLRCVIGNEENGPSHGYGSWATEIYELLHFRKIVTISYTQMRLEDICAVCPFDVIDYRYIRKNAYDLS